MTEPRSIDAHRPEAERKPSSSSHVRPGLEGFSVGPEDVGWGNAGSEARPVEEPPGVGPRGGFAVVATLVKREPVLAAVGVAGLAVALLCLVAVAGRGAFIPPEGKMSDAVTFTFGVAVFTLSMAAILPLADYSAPAARRWRWSYLSFAVYGLVLEPIQAFRGLDPRFSDAGGTLDVIAGIVFGVLALVATIAFLFLGARFFRADVLDDRPLLGAAIRYGSVAVTISFGVGILMSVVSGRVVGADGNLMAAHALGVHGIQAVPLVALGLLRAGSGVRRGPWLHAAGIGWLVACSAALVQALLGLRPLEASLPSVLMVIGLAVWGAAAARALWSWHGAI